MVVILALLMRLDVVVVAMIQILVVLQVVGDPEVVVGEERDGAVGGCVRDGEMVVYQPTNCHDEAHVVAQGDACSRQA